MGLREIQSAGENAGRLIRAARNIYRLANEYGPDYDQAIAAVREYYGQDALLGALTDEQISAFWLGGSDDTTAITEARAILSAWEHLALAVSAEAATLPGNNI